MNEPNKIIDGIAPQVNEMVTRKQHLEQQLQQASQEADAFIARQNRKLYHRLVNIQTELRKVSANLANLEKALTPPAPKPAPAEPVILDPK
jgi:DNA anti-recombination protein RmuC